MYHILRGIAAALVLCAAPASGQCQTGVPSLDSQLNRISSLLTEAESEIAKNQDQCEKIDRWLESPSQRQRSMGDFDRALEEHFTKGGGSSPWSGTELEQSVSKLVDLHREIATVEDAIKKSVTKTEEAADGTCAAPDKARLAAGQALDLSQKARALGVLTQGLADRIRTALAENFAKLAHSPPPRVPTSQSWPGYTEFGTSCGLEDDLGRPINLPWLRSIGKNLSGRVHSKFREFEASLDYFSARVTDPLGEEQHDAAKRLLSEYRDRFERIRPCIENADQAQGQCSAHIADRHGAVISGQLEELNRRRNAAADRIRHLARNVDALLERSEAAQVKASGCAETAKPEEAAKDAEDCTPLFSRLQVARSHFARKQGLADTKSELDGIQASLDAMDVQACSDAREEATKLGEQVRIMRDGLSNVKEDLTKCEPERLRWRAAQLSRKEHVWLKSLGERARRSVAVAEHYQKGNEAYLAGNMKAAREAYNEALREANASGEPTCTNIVERIIKNISKIARVSKQQDWISRVASSCDVPLIRVERNKMAPNAKLSFQYAMVDQLDAAMGTCQSQSQEAVEVREKHATSDRQAVCAKDFGEGYVVGHILEDGRFFCKPTQATADRWCEAKNGTGHNAVEVDERGGITCRPSKETADAWCNSNNSGSGWYAGAIKSDGTYDCRLSESGQKAAAEADCRKKYGRRLIRIYKSKGRYWCEHQRPQVARKRPKGRRQPQPGYDPQAAAAAAAAVAGAIAQGIQAGQRSKRVKKRCHRNPYTGQIHCGAN